VVELMVMPRPRRVAGTMLDRSRRHTRKEPTAQEPRRGRCIHLVQVAASSSKVTVLAAIAGNGTLAAIKFVVATLSGSSAILAEAIHSVLDTLNELLLPLWPAAQPPAAR
jgi:Co/Zn/Cd efflux system component